MLKRSSIRVTLAVGLFVGVFSGGNGALAQASHVGAIGVGQAIFWNGPYIQSAGVHSPIEPVACHGATGTTIGCVYSSFLPPTPPVCVPDSCIEYTIEVLSGQGTLRVALDQPTFDNKMSFILVDPSGAPVTWAWNAGIMTYERRVSQPAVGRWTIQVLLHWVERSAFRMRAYLEPPVAPPGGVVLQLPNLQVSPPHDLTFDGCQATEILVHTPQRCLRFSTGPNNVGTGPLDLRIREFGLTGPEVQRIYYSNGTFTERMAGTFEYHVEHAHYHHVGTAQYQLYRVTNPVSGTMERIGDGPKIGFCLFDSVMADWASFAQEPQETRTGECNGRIVGPPIPQVLEPALNWPMFGLSTGWGDSYAYTVEGNYVDFGDAGNGSYVIRVATDPDNTILESGETDNLGYTYFSVTGDEITVLERGRGSDPWDPSRVIVNDGRRPVGP